eukprot:1159300-Pelagomonas_calceolata.AAC.2
MSQAIDADVWMEHMSFACAISDGSRCVHVCLWPYAPPHGASCLHAHHYDLHELQPGEYQFMSWCCPSWPAVVSACWLPRQLVLPKLASNGDSLLAAFAAPAHRLMLTGKLNRHCWPPRVALFHDKG